MEHTPTPWPEPRYDNDVNPGFSEWWEVEGVASFDNEDDALFAVHCVNSHASLVEENKRMREALKPFAQIVEDETMMAAGDDDADEWFRWDGSVLTVGDFRRAKDALGDTNA